MSQFRIENFIVNGRSVEIPSITTVVRDSLTVQQGAIINNSDTNIFQRFNGVSWDDIATGSATNIQNSQLSQMVANTVKGNATNLSDNPQDLPINTNSVLGRLLANIQNIPILDEDNMVSNSNQSLATQQSIKAYVDNLVASALVPQGTWNANTNTPTLTSSVGTIGHLYVVDVAGSTLLDGENSWGVGDVLFFANGIWNKVPGAIVTSWGSITGTLSAQTDLQNALNSKPTIGGDTTTGNMVIGTNNAFGFSIETDNITRFFITENGRVGIGTTVPDNSSILELTSTNSALRLTRLTTAQRDSITPIFGLLIYNTSTNTLNYHNGTSWIELSSFVIANDSITNVMLANMEANTVKLNNTSSTADPINFNLSPNSLLGRKSTLNGGNITSIPFSQIIDTPQFINANSTSFTIDLAVSNKWTVDLRSSIGNQTVTINNATSGQTFTIVIIDNVILPRILTFPTNTIGIENESNTYRADLPATRYMLVFDYYEGDPVLTNYYMFSVIPNLG